MLRKTAIEVISQCLQGPELIIGGVGSPSFDLASVGDRKRNFYMLGSMGLAGSIGLGLAVAQPDEQVIVLDGDGSLLMGLNQLPTLAAVHPNNLLYVLLDNGTYELTGNQPTHSQTVDFPGLFQSAGFQKVIPVSQKRALESAIRSVLAEPDFAAVIARIETDPSGRKSPRPENVFRHLLERKIRFIDSVTASDPNH